MGGDTEPRGAALFVESAFRRRRCGLIGADGGQGGFLAAKSPLPPTTLGNLVKRWRTRGQSASDLTPEMRPTGSAAGNTGRAKRA